MNEYLHILKIERERERATRKVIGINGGYRVRNRVIYIALLIYLSLSLSLSL
jgi:hypothetical protein